MKLLFYAPRIKCLQLSKPDEKPKLQNGRIRPCRAGLEQRPRELFLEGLGGESRRSARRPHTEFAASSIANLTRSTMSLRQPSTPPSPTSPRKFADVDWCSRKINRNKICAECWPGAAFGPYWLLTERLRYETTPLLPALRDRLHVHGRRDVAHGGHRGSHAASGNSRAAVASRRQEQRHRQG